MPRPEIRGLFPCASELAFLNTATYGPGPQPVMQAVLRALRDWSTGRGDWRDWERAAEAARAGFARLLGAPADSIALLGTLSAAASQAAHDLAPPSEGRDVIVVGAGEFRSNLFPWLAQEERGFEVRAIEFRDGRLDPDELAAAVDARTALVAASLVQSSNGYRLPLGPVRAACARHGARLFLDATQCAGALRIDLEGVDYVGVSGYKWLFAPRGTSFLYVAPQHIPSLRPLTPSWKTPEEPHAEYYGPPYELSSRASRADHSLAWHPWVGAAAALELLNEVGIDAIERHGLALAERFRAGAAQLGLHTEAPPEECSQIVGVRVPSADAVSAALERAGVVAAMRHGYLRVSFALFNDESDVDRALGALADALRSA